MDNIDNIIGSIYVSGYERAKDFDGDVLFVHHDVEYYSKGLHIPLLSKRPNSHEDRTGAKVNEFNLELIVRVIENSYTNNTPLLVHCRGGVERSPLCVVSWLATRDSGHTLDTAYEYVKYKRSVVEDRRYWLG